MAISQITIDFPLDGSVLNKHHGLESDECLQISVRGKAPQNTEISINGVKTLCPNGSFSTTIALKQQFNIITTDSFSSHKDICVIWDKNSFKRYNFFIDDNIFFLTDIYKKRFKSIFESFYLAKLRGFHKKYGAKFVLNVFFRNDHEAFDISQFPDRFKGEWDANTDWLRLAFHAFSEFPGNPYGEHFPDKLPEHFALVREQITRFAGEKTFCPPCIIHYYDVKSVASIKFLKANGTTALAICNFPQEMENTLMNILYERDSGLFRMPVDFFCNCQAITQIRDTLQKCIAKPWKDTVNIGTHEQYSFPFYANYIPDHFERIETALRIVTENGYKPVFFHENLLGSKNKIQGGLWPQPNFLCNF